jgi:hypothetical protein
MNGRIRWTSFWTDTFGQGLRLSVLLCLNELSCVSDLDRQRINDSMADFVELLRQCRRWRQNVSVTQVPLTTLEIGPGYPVRAWAADGRNRDRWLFIRTLQNRAPFSAVFSGDTLDQVEYQIDGARADGVGTAHLVDGLAVSLPVSPPWDRAWVRADRTLVQEDEDGEIELVKDGVEVRHASRPLNLLDHEQWAKSSGVERLRTGMALWGPARTTSPIFASFREWRKICVVSGTTGWCQ